MTSLGSRFSRAMLGSPHTIRGFHHTDWARYQGLMRDGISFSELPPDSDIFAADTGRQRVEAEEDVVWPLGGMWLLESADDILCICRMMVFPTHAQLRRATMSDRRHGLLLVELLSFVFRRCADEGVKWILIEEDITSEQAEKLADRLGWRCEVTEKETRLWCTPSD